MSVQQELPSDVIFRSGVKVRPIISFYVKVIVLASVTAVQFGHTAEP